MVLDASVARSKGELLQLEHQIVPRRNVVLAPDVADVARQTADIEGTDEIHGKRYGRRATLVLATLQLRGVWDAPGARNLSDKADGVANIKRPPLSVRVLHETEVDHELLPIQSVMVVPEALQPREDVVHRNNVH